MLLKSLFIRGKYLYHLFQHRHNELLQQDCLNEEMKSEFKVKSLYHNNKAIEMEARIV